MRKFLFIFGLLYFGAASLALSASIITWTAASAGYWSAGGNWSGNAVPVSGDLVIFSASSTANITVNQNANVSGITITAGYTGLMTPTSTHTITVGAGGFSQSGGTLRGGPGAITVNGPFSLNSGGTFISTSGNLYLYGSSTFAGVFQNNSGTVILGATSTTITGSSTFNNLWLGDGSSNNFNITVATGTVLTVQASTTFATNYSMVYLLGGGEIDAGGDVFQNNYTSGTIPTSTFNFVLNGASTQTMSDSGFYNLIVPSITINKSSGAVNLRGSIDVTGNWTNNASSSVTMNPGTSTVGFIASSPSRSFAITGSSTFYNLNFSSNLSGNEISATVSSGTFTVQNDLMMSANSAPIQLLGTGTINVAGNIDGGAAGSGSSSLLYATGTASIVLNGTGTQIIDNDISGGILFLPDLTVAKPSGVAYVTNSPNITGNVTLNQGELRLAMGSVAQTVEIDGRTTIASGAILSDYPNSSSTIVLGSRVTNSGLVFFDGAEYSCVSSTPNGVILNSTTTGQRVPWVGSGNFVMRYVNVEDQGGTAPISVWDGTNSGDVAANWTFSNGNPVPELIQTSTASGGSGTSQITLPSFGFQPRAGDLILVAVSGRNQSITTPTDNASNTYTLAASSTFGSSPSYALSLYYAKNITTTSSLAVTAHGGGGSGSMLSASAFEYTGMDAFSTFDQYSANTDTSGSATLLTSFSATGRSANELYFGTMTFSASTTASYGTGWSGEVGAIGNSATQALYNEDVASSSLLTTAATWTSATATSYAAIMGIFRSPYTLGYAPSGTLESAIFDTGVSGGAQLNSFIWQGSTPSNSSVDFQFAASNSPAGPWNFEGSDGTANSYFSGMHGTSINFVSTNSGYGLFNGYRYFRYRAILFSSSADIYTPIVTQVTVNWSP